MKVENSDLVQYANDEFAKSVISSLLKERKFNPELRRLLKYLLRNDPSPAIPFLDEYLDHIERYFKTWPPETVFKYISINTEQPTATLKILFTGNQITVDFKEASGKYSDFNIDLHRYTDENICCNGFITAEELIRVSGRELIHFYNFKTKSKQQEEFMRSLNET